MIITAESELMKNQKHADIMAPDLAFNVLQTPDGDSLFFSIGTDHVFYVTREVRSAVIGWDRVDLSSSLSESNGGAVIKAKSFALGQNPKTLHFDLSLVVDTNGADTLYMSRGHANIADDWSKTLQWIRVPFDAAGVNPPRPLTIADIYMMTIPDMDDPTSQGVLNTFVDIIRKPGDPLQLLDRYYIVPDTPTKWARHALAIDLKAGSISSCLGHRVDDPVPGIYTYGLIDKTRELIFTPQRNFFKPDNAPLPSRLVLPDGATAVTSALNGDGDTNLFVAATGGLYVFPPDRQYDGAHPTLIVPNVTVGSSNFFAGVTTLSAMTIGNKTVVTAVNTQGELFHVDCRSGSETSVSGWSHPLPFTTGVESFAFYINKNASNIVLFAHLSVQNMIQFTQQPSGEWIKRSILLPPTKVDEYIEYNSFTTHLIVRDDHGSPAPSVTVSFVSEVAVTVYVNNVYHLLTPDIPVHVNPDPTGALTVVQETDTLAGVKMTAKIEGPTPVTIVIDPISKLTVKLQSIHSGTDLGDIMIIGENGKEKPLIPTDISASTLDNVANSLKQLLKAKDDIVQKSDGAPAPSALATSSEKPTVLASATFINTSDSLAESIEVAAEDFFNFFKQACDEVINFTVRLTEDTWHFIVKIGDVLYHAFLDTVAAIVNAIEFVFNKIKVTFENLVRWLGFVFNWDDINRTHRVIKYAIKAKTQSFIDSIDGIETSIETFFMDLEDKINAWGGITDPGQAIGLHQQASRVMNSSNGADSPQSNWATYHTQNGADAARTNGVEKPPTQTSALMKIVGDLEAMVVNESEYIKTTINQIKEQVVDEIMDLSPIEAFKRILAIASDLILKTARNVIVKLLDIFKIIAQSVLDTLDTPIEIPILSPLYKRLTGNELSALDLVCFVGAIFATTNFRRVARLALFPDEASVLAITSGELGITAKKLRTLSIPSTTSTSRLEVKKTARDFKPIVPSSSTMTITAPTINFATEGSKLEVDDPTPWSPLDSLTTAFTYLAGPGAALVVIFNTKKYLAQKKKGEQGEPGKVSRVIRAAAAASYLLYVGPDYIVYNNPASWFVIMNDVITAISVFKTFADNYDGLCNNSPGYSEKVSPIAESVINFIWLIPAVGGYLETDDKTTDIYTMFAANIVFDASGIISPGTTLFPKPWDTVAFVAQQVLAGCYGFLATASGFLIIYEAKASGKLK